MITTFINPAGRTNQADLTPEQITILKSMSTYTVVDNFDFNLPEVESSSPNIRIHSFGESSCVACES